MITTDFLPDDLNIPASPPYNVKLTDNVGDLALSYPDGWPDAYYYGWLRWENVPDYFKISNVDVIYGGGPFGMAARSAVQEQNYNIGYVSRGYSAYSSTWYRPENMLFYSEYSSIYGDPASSSSPYLGTRFINQLDPQGVAPLDLADSANAVAELGLFVCVYYSTTPSADMYGTKISFNDGQELLDFLNGNITKSLYITGATRYGANDNTRFTYSFTYTLDISSADFSRTYNNVWSFTATSGGMSFEVNVFISGFNFGKAADYINEDDMYEHNSLGVVPLIAQTCNSTQYHLSGINQILTYTKFVYDYVHDEFNVAAHETDYFLPGSYSVSIADRDNKLFFGGFDCNLDLSGDGNNYINRRANFDGNCAIMYNQKGANNYAWYMMRVLSKEEILHAITLNMRAVDVTNTYGFGTGIYVPHISEENEFLCEWLTGDFATIKNKLRPWQYGDITDNEYKPEDMPPYEPPYEGDRFGGDSIRPFDFLNTVLSASNNFVTLYALSSDFIQAFGQAMWADLGDPNFWHMVGVEFSNDFSINPADMMKYFISLRYYPIDLTPYSSYEGGVYIGRATQAIEPGAATLPYRITQNVIHIDGGSVEVRMDHFNTNDFRVYDPNTQVTVYVPYCGNVQLSASEVYGSTLYLDYTLDMQTGSLKACISTSQNETSYNLIATLSGSIGADIQLTANNNIEFLQRIASVVTGTVTQTGSMAMQGAMAGGEVGAAVGAVAGALTGGVSSLASLPPVTVHKQGTAAGFANLGGANRAYITIQTGIYDVTNDFGKVHGWRCNLYSSIGDLTGFTVCSNVNTDGLTCTGEEAAEIKRILESGFYA